MSVERCPECGQKLDDWKLDEHVEECDGEPPTPWTGSCPMCGEAYDDYMNHIKHCQEAFSGKKNAAGVGADVEPTDGWEW